MRDHLHDPLDVDRLDDFGLHGVHRHSLRLPARRASAATCRSHSRCGTAGLPPTVSPAATSRITPACAAMRAPAPMRRWPVKAALPAHDDEILQHGTSGDAGLRHDHAAAAEADVVPYLYQIINPAARPDHRIRPGAAVDGGIGADLDVVADDHPAELRHLHVAGRVGREAEPVLAQPRAGEDPHPRADHGIAHRGAGPDVRNDRRSPRPARYRRRARWCSRGRSRHGRRSPRRARRSCPPRCGPSGRSPPRAREPPSGAGSG